MALRRTVDPGEEPVTLAEAKLWCSIDGPEWDSIFTTIVIPSVREQAEDVMQRTLIASTWMLTLDEFPASIRLPMPRVSAVSMVQYVDAAGATQTLSSAGYVLDNASEYANWVTPAAGYAWPETARDRVNNVIVTYTAGWASAAAVPAKLKKQLLKALAADYKYREGIIDVANRTASLELPRSFYEALFDSWIVPTV